jgi:hypothetical protein
MLGALAFIEPQIRVCALPLNTHRLSWMTYRNLSAERAWQRTDIAGAGPKDLAGTLSPCRRARRICEGVNKECHATRGHGMRDGGRRWLAARIVDWTASL